MSTVSIGLPTLLKSIYKETDQGRSIPLHEPEFLGNEWRYVKDCLDTGWVSSVGQYVDLFEKKIAEFTGAKHAVVTSCGTSALHMCYLAAGVESDDEVLMPSLTFVATANAVSYLGAIPHFVDVNPNTLSVDPALLEWYLQHNTIIKDGFCINKNTSRRIKALCVMHALGMPADIAPLSEICQMYKLELIEDAAEALGSYYHDKHVGSFGLCGALSFNGNKIITTGGGGAFITNDAKLAKRIKHLTTTAKEAHAWEFRHDAVGYNYRLPNLNAALGCAQIERLPEILEQKRILSQKLKQIFIDDLYLSFKEANENSQSNHWLNAVSLIKPSLSERDKVLSELNAAGLMARPLWNLMHTLPMYASCPSMPLENSLDAIHSVICLPSSAKFGRGLS